MDLRRACRCGRRSIIALDVIRQRRCGRAIVDRLYERKISRSPTIGRRARGGSRRGLRGAGIRRSPHNLLRNAGVCGARSRGWRGARCGGDGPSDVRGRRRTAPFARNLRIGCGSCGRDISLRRGRVGGRRILLQHRQRRARRIRNRRLGRGASGSVDLRASIQRSAGETGRARRCGARRPHPVRAPIIDIDQCRRNIASATIRGFERRRLPTGGSVRGRHLAIGARLERRRAR